MIRYFFIFFVSYIILNSSLFAQEQTRICTKNDLVGDIWSIVKMKVYDEEKLKNPTQYLFTLTSEFQLIKFTNDNEIRSVYVKNNVNDFLLLSKMLEFSQGESFDISNDSVLTITRNNGVVIDRIVCYYIDSSDNKIIPKDSIMLLRFEDNKPLIALVYKKLKENDLVLMNNKKTNQEEKK